MTGTERSWGWRHRAGCRGVDPELFFPVGTEGPALAQTVTAKSVCARCPVTEQCLAFALVAIPDGVAGGLSAEERRALRRARVAAGSCAPAVVAREQGAGLAGVPVGVDGLVVAGLVAGHRLVGASREERAWAAVMLHRAGRASGWIAAWLGVGDQQVRRWVARARAGQPLNPRGGPRWGAVA